ncbi:MAG: tetraacyldisaccharide 4'-kinase, partial [Maritimibacter sp.]
DPLARGTRPEPTQPLRLPVPVIAVGSLSLGGTGKTPAVIAIAQRLVMQGKAVHVITLGPGAPMRVDEQAHSPAEIGDEPLLIAAFAPCWLGRDWGETARAAIAAGAEILLLDGGVPDPIAEGQISVMVEDAVQGFGNGFAWPLGPLKRKLTPGLAQADLLIAIGHEAACTRLRDQWQAALPCPLATGQLLPLPTGMDWDGLDVVAFAGINTPERFFATLRGLGANLIRAQALTDHQELTPALMTRLSREAQMAGAQLVTTEKDAVRLPRAFRENVISLPVRLELGDWAPLDALFA